VETAVAAPAGDVAGAVCACPAVDVEAGLADCGAVGVACGGDAMGGVAAGMEVVGCVVPAGTLSGACAVDCGVAALAGV